MLSYSWIPVEMEDGRPYRYPASLSRRWRVEAVYRWIVHGGERPRFYIGESEDLQKRVYGYLNPGPSQKTNKRLHELFDEEVSVGHIVTLETLHFEPFDILSAHFEMSDLRDRHIRRFLEGLLVAVATRQGSDVLNVVEGMGEHVET